MKDGDDEKGDKQKMRKKLLNMALSSLFVCANQTRGHVFGINAIFGGRLISYFNQVSCPQSDQSERVDQERERGRGRKK